MAYYDVYRNAPGWGTANYQFVTPMQPSYQPQPGWRGIDYYQAHGGLGDPDIYDYAWNRVRSHPSVGVGKEEARLWHRRAYGGLGDILRMLPRDVGAAAAYEAWRNWKYHYGIYAQPLGGDRDRQLEALTGLAVSEATRLWQHTGRPTDTYGCLEASEAAAGTAAHILEQHWMLENGAAYDPYPGRGRLSRRGSAASLRSYSPLGTYSRPVSPFLGDGYDVPAYAGSVGSYSPSVSAYDAGVPHVRRRAYSNAAAYPVTYSTMQGSSPYLQPAAYTPGYPYAQPAYASTPGVTVIQPTSPHHSHSHHRHRSGSRRRSSSRHSRHRHSGSYSSYGGTGSYYVGSAVPYAGY